MKKHFLFLPLIVAMMAACSSNDPVIEDEQEEPVTPVAPVIPDEEDDYANWELSLLLDLTEDEKAAVTDLNRFSYELLKGVSNEGDGEYCCSPASVSIYLSMLANAAGGDSRQEILSALHLSDIETVNSLNAKLMHYLPCAENGAALSINNRFWVADRYNVTPGFVTTMQEVFNGKVKSVDFTDPITVPTINKWVADNTNGLISSILDGDWKNYIDLDLASANTVYFKGNWLDKFNESKTVKEQFRGSKGNKQVDMMHQTTRTGYASNDKFSMVCKNFNGGPVNAEFYLPAEGISVNDFTALLTPEMQASLKESCKLYDVTLSLPKFSTDKEVGLDKVLTGMGINLSNMDLTSMGLQAAPMKVLHKTSLKIYEEGAELAAVTGGILTAPDPGEVVTYPKVTVHFNRPFCYIIRHSQTGIILMAGVVSDIE
ncbi:MAG: hypothetical protein K2M07_07100 [Muribaculaceae bacterium]|nr:hypothetical protein [Muribaculaceae bacterium]